MGFYRSYRSSQSNGYTFDDIRVYEVFNDMQMLSIDAPVTSSCGLTNNSTIKVTVRNSSNAVLNNVPIKYRINNGPWVSELIPSIAGNSTMQYGFTTPADLSAVNTYNIQAIVELNSDSFHENDTTSATIINSPVISRLPLSAKF